MDIRDYLHYTVSHNASDLHLSSEMPPLVRIDDELMPIPGSTKLDSATIKSMLRSFLPESYHDALDNQLDIDLGLSVPGIDARFRVNIFHQLRGMSAALRHIPSRAPTLDELNFSDVFYQLCELQNGLILVTGPTGSGKSTTLAAMVDYVNSSESSHILTIEDPIEYIHPCKKCLVQQREVRRDTNGFEDALRSALREDPDYILVGEMRDLETIRLALTAAETGHLVFATLHTNSAADSIDRIIDVFPTFEKSLIRSIVANSLQAVVSQVLLKKVDGGRVAAQEIMICTTAIRNLIRENKIPQIYSAIQTGQEKNMRTLAQHVKELAARGIVDKILYSNFLVA